MAEESKLCNISPLKTTLKRAKFNWAGVCHKHGNGLVFMANSSLAKGCLLEYVKDAVQVDPGLRDISEHLHPI